LRCLIIYICESRRLSVTNHCLPQGLTYKLMLMEKRFCYGVCFVLGLLTHGTVMNEEHLIMNNENILKKQK